MADRRGYRAINISYALPPSTQYIELRVVKGGFGTIEGFERAEKVEVQGVEGILFRNLPAVPNATQVAWEKDGYGLIADTRVSDDFTLRDFLQLLETIS